MSALQVIHREFAGVELALLQREDGTVLMTSEQIGLGLGYTGGEGQRADAVNKVYHRRMAELAPFRVPVKLTGPGGTQEVTCWRREAIYLFACFARTDRAAEFRAWLVTTCDELERGDKVLIDRSRLEEIMGLVSKQADAIGLLADAMRQSASLAGSMLASFGVAKRKHPRLLSERPDQTLMGFYEAELIEAEGDQVEAVA